jgi:hypothetical protein
MSVTQGTLGPARTGLNLPVPRVFVNPNGLASGSHDSVSVGGLSQGDFDRLAPHKPFIALLRYKSGHSPSVTHALGSSSYNYDNKRGWVHPSSWDGANDVSRVRNGRHNSRSGNVIPERITERDLTANNQYQIFTLDNWFLDFRNQPYQYPIVRVADINANFGGGNPSLNGMAYGNEAYAIGQNGQGTKRTFAGVNIDRPMFCGSDRTVGNQVQYFAFCLGADDPDRLGQVVFGAPSATIKAEIFPRVLIKYAKPFSSDRGRKIKLHLV